MLLIIWGFFTFIFFFFALGAGKYWLQCKKSAELFPSKVHHPARTNATLLIDSVLPCPQDRHDSTLCVYNRKSKNTFSGDIHQSNLPSVLLEIPPVPLWLWILSLRLTINKWICTQTHTQLHTHVSCSEDKDQNRVTDPYGWTHIEGIECLHHHTN